MRIILLSSLLCAQLGADTFYVSSQSAAALLTNAAHVKADINSALTVFKLGDTISVDAMNAVGGNPSTPTNAYTGYSSNSRLIGPGGNTGVRQRVTAATNANPAVFTSAGHGMTVTTTFGLAAVTLFGFTGNWAVVNGLHTDVTVLSSSTFSIASINSTGFGAVTGAGFYQGTMRMIGFDGNAATPHNRVFFNRATAAITTGFNGKGIFQVASNVVFDLEYADLGFGGANQTATWSPPGGCTNNNCDCIGHESGGSLILKYSALHDCGNGILSPIGDPTADYDVEHCMLYRNGAGQTGAGQFGLTHNSYFGNARNLTYRYNVSFDSMFGHLLKARVYSADIEYNTIINPYNYACQNVTGNSFFGGCSNTNINIPIGGIDIIKGNVIMKGPNLGNLGTQATTVQNVIQYNDECTKDGVTHGRHWFYHAELTADINSSQTTINVDPSWLYAFPQTGTFTGTIRTANKLGASMTLTQTSIVIANASEFPAVSTCPTVGTTFDAYVNDERITFQCQTSTNNYTVVRAVSPTKGATHFNQEPVNLFNPEQITITAANMNTTTGVITGVVRAANGVSGSHAADPGTYIEAPIYATELHVINNSMVMSPFGNPAWANGTWWSGGPNRYAFVLYGNSFGGDENNTYQPIPGGPVATNPGCQYNTANAFGAPEVRNNLAFGPATQLLPGISNQQTYANFADLQLVTPTQATSAAYTFTSTIDSGQIIDVTGNAPGGSGCTNGQYTISSVVGGAANTSAPMGTAGGGPCIYRLYGAIPAPVQTNNVVSSTYGDLTGGTNPWWFSPEVDTLTGAFVPYTSGFYLYNQGPSAPAGIKGTGFDYSTSTPTYPCGGPGLSQTCDLKPSQQPLFPADAASRADSLDIGAFKNGFNPVNSGMTITVPSISVGSSGTVTVAISPTLSTDQWMFFISSDETIAPAPDPVFVPANQAAPQVQPTISVLKAGAFNVTGFIAGKYVTSGTTSSSIPTSIQGQIDLLKGQIDNIQ